MTHFENHWPGTTYFLRVTEGLAENSNDRGSIANDAENEGDKEQFKANKVVVSIRASLSVAKV